MKLWVWPGETRRKWHISCCLLANRPEFQEVDGLWIVNAPGRSATMVKKEKPEEARRLMEQDIKPWWNTRLAGSDTRGTGPWAAQAAERADELTASWGWPSFTPSMRCLATAARLSGFPWERLEKQNCMWSALSLNVWIWFTFLKHFRVLYDYLWLGTVWSDSGPLIEEALYTVLKLRRKRAKVSMTMLRK